MKQFLVFFEVQKKTKSKNPRVAQTNKAKSTFLSNCAVCDSVKSRFFKHQEASRLLRNLGLKIPLSGIPILRDTKINRIVNMLFFARAKFMPEMHLRY